MTSSSGPPVGAVATGHTSSAAIDIPPTRRGCCACGCACGCNSCSCRSKVDIIDPNREEYGGEGTAVGVGAMAQTQPRSYVSANSMDSVRDSSDAPRPTANVTAAAQTLDTIRDLHGRQDPTLIARSNVDRFINDLVDDECPWRHFLEPSSRASDAMDEDEDECAAGSSASAPFWPIEVGGDSMRNHAALDRAEQQTLSSFMSSLSLHPPSVVPSDVVRGAGGAFAPRAGAGAGPVHAYLRLN